MKRHLVKHWYQMQRTSTKFGHPTHDDEQQQEAAALLLQHSIATQQRQQHFVCIYYTDITGDHST